MEILYQAITKSKLMGSVVDVIVRKRWFCIFDRHLPWEVIKTVKLTRPKRTTMVQNIKVGSHFFPVITQHEQHYETYKLRCETKREADAIAARCKRDYYD